MTNLGYNITVVIFWLATMTWLVWTKVLPPLVLGTPPTYASMIDSGSNWPVAWDIFWDGARVGLATTEVSHGDDGVIVLSSRVDFHNVPTAKLNPLRIQALDDLIEQHHPRVSMWADARFDIDPLGRLLSFESALGSDLLAEPIRVMGNTELNRLKLVLRSRDFSYHTEIYLPPDRPIADVFSPQARLPGLRLGQSWTEPVYSPFSPPNRPIELLRARVEREDFLVWGGMIEPTLLVVYRTESGSRAGGTPREARGQTWVRRDGTVLQQEARIGASVLRFVRQGRRMEKESTVGSGQREGAVSR